MTGQCGIADPHFGNSRKGRLERSKQLTAKLTVQLIPGVCLGDIAADIGIKQHGVANPVAVFAEAADGDVHVDERPLIHYPEGNRAGSAIFISEQLLDVKIVDPLILGRFPAKSKAFSNGFEGIRKTGTEVTGENRWLRGAVVGEFAGLGAELYHLALLHNHHTLTIRHSDDRAIRYDIV